MEPLAEILVIRGVLIHLIQIDAGSLLQDGGVSVSLRFGRDPMPAPCSDPADVASCGQHLSGEGSFEVEPTVPTIGDLAGSIEAGQLDAGPGLVRVETPVFPGAEPLTLTLVGARVEADEVGSVLSGTLGGGIRASDIDETFLAALTTAFGEIVAQDCSGTSPPCCTSDTVGDHLVRGWDEDRDCSISLEEVRDEPLTWSMLSPDVDLLDAGGAPGSDGVKESLSFGLRFTAVPASFSIP